MGITMLIDLSLLYGEKGTALIDQEKIDCNTKHAYSAHSKIPEVYSGKID